MTGLVDSQRSSLTTAIRPCEGEPGIQKSLIFAGERRTMDGWTGLVSKDGYLVKALGNAARALRVQSS